MFVLKLGAPYDGPLVRRKCAQCYDSAFRGLTFLIRNEHTHTQKRIYANQFHHHCSFSFLLISFQEIWKVDWAEIEAREERDSDLPWVIEASILFTVAKIDNNAKC